MVKTWALLIATLAVVGTAAGAGVASVTPPARCTSAQLKITRSNVQSGLGHRVIVLRFKNQGVACTLHGYPGADALSATLKRVASAKRSRSGYFGGLKPGEKLPVVHLGKGQTASALLDWVGGPIPHGGCVHARYLLITAPNTTRSVRFAPAVLKTEELCQLYVHPVVAGKTGRG